MFVFFFKQKTAYELRISDWSSDVCSSDLSSIWTTFETLKELYRPAEQSGWKLFSSSRKIAWKTGTSFGFRDGWAIGVNGDYAVGVWVGNADGEGRSGQIGRASCRERVCQYV